jgi:predicted dehydrogenase
VLKLLPEYKLSVLYSQRREAARAAAAQHGFHHVAASLEELVNHPEVDFVVVLTTAPQHEEAIRAAIAAGKDVYSEWPLTPSTGTSEQMVRLADDAGVRTVTGWGGKETEGWCQVNASGPGPANTITSAIKQYRTSGKYRTSSNQSALSIG